MTTDAFSLDVRDIDFDFAQTGARDEQRKRDVEGAQLYADAFGTPAGQALLAMWDEDMEKLRVTSGQLVDYVTAESQRNFIRKIHQKIALAATGGKS